MATRGRGYVIQLVGLVNGDPHPLDGQYVRYYHPGPKAMARGECWLTTTRNPAYARVYPTKAAATEEYRRVDPRIPVRADGKPNRPMTAWTILVSPAP